MNCMKCGRKIKDRQVFCDDCLAIMDTYPVKPGTPIQLPTPAKPVASQKNNKRRPKKAEEQILQLRSSVRWLSVALVVAIFSFIIVVIMLLWLLNDPEISLSVGDIPRFF